MSCMHDEHAAGIEVSQIEVDRLCGALAAIAFDWWRRQAHKETADDRNPMAARNGCTVNAADVLDDALRDA